MSEEVEPQARCEQLKAINALMRELLQLESYDDMLDAVLQHAIAIVDAERGFLVLRHGDALDFKVVRNWNREELESGNEVVSRTLVAQALKQEQPLLVEDALTDPRFKEQRSVRELHIRSVLAAAIHLEDKVIGAIYLESRSVHRFFRSTELELFKEVLDVSAHALQTGLSRLALEQRNALLEKDLLARYNFQGIVTRDAAFLRTLRTVAQLAESDLPVLIQGPSGSGKELVARALHLNSPRKRRPMVTINCAAIVPSLLESELFGHVKGAFTGAVRDKPGLIPSADMGTVLLDEVGELPLELQGMLLRTLQFGEVQPIGTTRMRTVNVRFVAATNRDLLDEMKEGRFREDLFYRLSAVTIHVPPLAERRDDVLPLFYNFLGRACEATGRPEPKVSSELEKQLRAYDWPGNVRELENETARLLALTPVGETLSAERLSVRIADRLATGSAQLPTLAEQERDLVERHLQVTGGNRTHAARNLGISRETLRLKLKRYGLS